MRLKHLMLGTVAALATVGTAQAAYNTPTGWYMSLGAGANWIDDGNIDEFDASGTAETTNEFDWESGYVVSGAIGYDFGEHWRAEFEVAFRKNDVESFCASSDQPTCSDTIDGADIWELSQMVNVLYDISLGGDWEAAVGAGIGGNLVVFNPGNSNNFEDENDGIDTDDYVLAGQLIAQVAYRLSERWKLFADYHYMFMDEPDVVNPEDQETWVIEKTEHSLMLGIRFDLQRDGAAPPPRTPDRGAPKQFIVFFGFNKSNLTAEAARVVADAAAAAKEYGSATISVVGHTDTVGSNEYNIRLSMRRSQTVKDGLVANGIAANAISTGGRGETELMVQTGDSVKEPQNRRATIDLN
jgi:OmpA-OmpF porin, OOP family